jgi:hypothetical protein
LKYNSTTTKNSTLDICFKLLDSFTYEQRKKIDEAWAQEAESRIDAYEKGSIESIPLSKVFEEIPA